MQLINNLLINDINADISGSSLSISLVSTWTVNRIISDLSSRDTTDCDEPIELSRINDFYNQEYS